MGEKQYISFLVRSNCNNESGLHKGCNFYKYLLIIRSKKDIKTSKGWRVQRTFWFRTNIIVPLGNLRMLWVKGY